MKTPTGTHSCDRSVDRRTFLSDATLLAVAVLSQLGASRSVMAQTLGLITGEPAPTGGTSYALPTSDGAFADTANKVLLVRANNSVYAFSLACPHRGASLVWHGDESRVYCPKHKAKFLPDGVHDSGRATRDLDRHPLRREGERVVVDIAIQLRADSNSAAWNAASLRLAA